MMNPLLDTYWIEFGESMQTLCGVTAYTYEDAIYLLQETYFNKMEMPPVIRYKEDIALEDIDQNHIFPNSGLISERGVWYPNFFPL